MFKLRKYARLKNTRLRDIRMRDARLLFLNIDI